jgi:hypothetical protein
MPPAPFWFVEDHCRVRWAVRIAPEPSEPEAAAGASIFFTSTERRISTPYPLDKEHSELTRCELLDLLARAKVEAVVRSHFAVAEMVAA